MAISKKKLQQLIEQGATIYSIKNESLEKIILNSNLDLITTFEWSNKYFYKGYDKKTMSYFYYNLENLFETKEDALWNLEMTATRTETLKLPKWEEFIQNDKQVIFYDKDKTYYLDKVMNRTHIIIGYKCIIDLNEELEANRYNFYRKPATKENYIEACKLCLKLFMGEKGNE